MIRMVKDVFLVIIGVTVAMILYLVLFGTYDLDGNSLVGTKTGNIEQTKEWQGVIWYMARSIETPISRYYFEYCYIPSVHQNDYVDEVLGGTKYVSYYDGNLQHTKTDLSNNSKDFYNFTSGTNGIYHYTTGWR